MVSRRLRQGEPRGGGRGVTPETVRHVPETDDKLSLPKDWLTDEQVLDFEDETEYLDDKLDSMARREQARKGSAVDSYLERQMPVHELPGHPLTRHDFNNVYNWIKGRRYILYNQQLRDYAETLILLSNNPLFTEKVPLALEKLGERHSFEKQAGNGLEDGFADALRMIRDDERSNPMVSKSAAQVMTRNRIR